MSSELQSAIISIDESLSLEITDQMLQRGDDPYAILEECRIAMTEIGSRFEKGEAFLPELIMGGEILEQISEKVRPFIKESNKREAEKKLGKVLIGTVAGDVHHIGKNIVAFMLDIYGFEVRDIGVDIEPEQFVRESESYQPHVVGLSCLLTTGFGSLKETVNAMGDAGLRSRCKIMIGGSPVDETILRFSEADAYGRDAVEAVSLAKGYVEEISGK